ncbi:uncharacterized protein LOC144100246 isoform X1 [Amblyomma americanum]
MIILLFLLMLKFTSDKTQSPKYKPGVPGGGNGGGKNTGGTTTTTAGSGTSGSGTTSAGNTSRSDTTGSVSSTDSTGMSSQSGGPQTTTEQTTSSSLASTSDSGGVTSDSMTSMSTLNSSTSSMTTTTTRLPWRLICVFEYLATALWSKHDVCTDYVYIRFFMYSTDKSQPLQFVFKQQKLNNIVNIYYDNTPALWRMYNRRLLDGRVKGAITRFNQSRWHLGMWGATYIRIIATLWDASVVRDALHYTLQGNFSELLSLSHFSGFAIINSILKDARPSGRALNYSDIFRRKASNPTGILEKNWTLIHTAAIWPGGSAIMSEAAVANLLREADVVGISTSNSTDEPNIVNTLDTRQSPYLAASPPNPINPAGPHTRGMLDILSEFPHWKQVLNRSRLCFSVTTAINYARNSVDKIDFVKPIRNKEDVQRYSRYQFTAGNNTVRYPVVEKSMAYVFDNNTHTHFWRLVRGGVLLSFFAYDDGNTLGYKVKEMLKAYPDDRCVVFDDLGEDGTAASFKANGTKYEFKAYDMLKAVLNALNETSVVAPTTTTA